MTVSELLARVSSRELSQWITFYEFEPFGSEADYLGHAITASTVANVNRGKHKAHKVEEFLPKFERQKETDITQAIGFAATMTAVMGGKDKRIE